MDHILEKSSLAPTMEYIVERPLLMRCALVGGFGVLVHHTVFKQNEWHMQGPRILKFTAAAYVVLALLEGRKSLEIAALGHAALLLGSFILSLFLSIAFYRAFGHRTRHFPGPRLAGVSKLWHMYQCRYGQNHLVLDNLHRQYGDFVRTGPSEVTVFHPEVLARLDGPGNKTQKSDWYDFLLPHVGVTTTRDRPFHDQRRRLWVKGFSSKSMEHYEEHIRGHARDLEGLIAADCKRNAISSLSTYFYWFSFDIMGLFTFSRSFDMLSKEDWHYAVRDLRRAMKILGPLSSVPWLAQIGFWLLKGYWIVKDWHTMISWCAGQMKHRIDEPKSHDVSQAIIDDFQKKNELDSNHPALIGDAVVAIVAGSDTVAPTLVFTFYELALNPEKADKLYEEVRDIDINDTKSLRKLSYLNAIIMETLRLHPAVPTGGYRDTPPEGMTIGGTFIPGKTTIVAPRYTLGRLESCYERPNEWLPERWDTEPELVKDSRSFLPFAQGRYTCLGKDVAMAEMLTVIALLVSKYRLSFPLDQDKDSIRQVEQMMRDQFTATPGSLGLIFTKREKEVV